MAWGAGGRRTWRSIGLSPPPPPPHPPVLGRSCYRRGVALEPLVFRCARAARPQLDMSQAGQRHTSGSAARHGSATIPMTLSRCWRWVPEVYVIKQDAMHLAPLFWAWTWAARLRGRSSTTKRPAPWARSACRQRPTRAAGPATQSAIADIRALSCIPWRRLTM